jgi:predicted Zn-dependent peptidase
MLYLIAAPDAPRAGASTPEELVLDNGMRVLLFPHPGSGMVASNVFVGAGSTREEERYAGSSHFLEHVLFNGTTRRTQEEIYALTDRIGAYNNATTRQEYTHYMMVVPIERLAEALDIQADMLLHSTLPPEKFEKERGIVLEELSKDKDDPDYRLEQALGELLYGPTSAFASPVLGTEETIATLPRPTVVEYYKRQYVPSNMRLVLMGDFDRDEALELVQKIFRSQPVSGPQGSDLTPSTERPLPGPSLALGAPAIVTTQEVDAPNTVIELALILPVATPEDAAALALLAHIAGGTKSSRLEQALDREPTIPHEETNASLAYREGGQLFVLRARLSADAEPSGAATRLLATLRSLEHIDEAEFAAAQTVMLTQEISQREKLHYYALFEGDRLWHMEEGFTQRYISALEKTEAADAGKLAQRLFANARIQIVAAGPGAETINMQLADLEPNMDMVQALQPQGSGSAFEPAHSGPSPLDADQPPEVIQLDNGLTVVHTAARSTRMFALHLLVKNRGLREPQGLDGIADLLHRSIAAIAEEKDGAASSPLDRIGATLKVADNPWIPYDNYYSTPLYSFVRLECVDEHYQGALELLTRMLRGPHDNNITIDDARKEMLSAIQRAGARPSNTARSKLNEILFPGHPLSRTVMGDGQALAGITPEMLSDFASDYFSPDQMILSVVGNVSQDEALAAVSATLGRLPVRGEGITAAPAIPLTEKAAREEIEGGGNQSSIRMGRVFDVHPGDRWALIVAVRIASSRMQQDLRETRGLAYSLGISVGYYGDRAIVTASMATRPENLEEAEAGMRSYLLGNGLEATTKEVETAISGYLSRMRMRRITSMGQAFNLGRDLFLKSGIDYSEREAAGLASITAQDVKRVAKQYLIDAPMVTVIAR